MELEGEAPSLERLSAAAFAVAEQVLADAPQGRLGSGLFLRWRRPGAGTEVSVIDFGDAGGTDALAARLGAVLCGRRDWAYAIVREIPQFDHLEKPWVRGLLQVLVCTMTDSLLSSHEIYRDFETAAIFRSVAVIRQDTPGFETGGVLRALLMPPVLSLSVN